MTHHRFGTGKDEAVEGRRELREKGEGRCASDVRNEQTGIEC